MSIFANAQGLGVYGGEFTATTITINNEPRGPTGIDILREASSAEAAHDSSARAYPPRCFPGTRAQYIEDIVNWAIPVPGDTPTPLYWMKGPAGVGKSAIAQTCAEKLQEQGALGAAFFFSSNGRVKLGSFFPSIAYQLSTIHPAYRDIVDRKIRRDRSIVNKAVRFQFQYLIDEPLRELEKNGKGIRRSVHVFIDGLDECDGADAQCEIIHIIAAAVSGGVVPLRWAFFSRSEPHIEAMFSSPTISPQCSKTMLPISSDANREIELYLRNGFEGILQRYSTSTQPQWPSSEDMQTVVGAAGGLFVYATTVLRFVGHPNSLGPRERLREIIDVILNRRGRDSHAITSTGAPFAELDAFYTLILQRIPSKILPSIHLLLGLLCQTGGLSVILAANLLGLPKDVFEVVCRHANATIHLVDLGEDLDPDPTIDTSRTYLQINQPIPEGLCGQVYYRLGGRVSFYHKSFADFLVDPVRSGSFCVKGSEALAKHYLQTRLDYDRNFCWYGSELVLAPGVSDSVSPLSYPYTNELVNSLIKVWVYLLVSGEDPESFSLLGELGRLDTTRDFRKRLHIVTHFRRIIEPDLSQRSWARFWGCEHHCKFFSGTRITWISKSEFSKFNVAEFKRMIKQHQQANILRPYHPNLTSRIKSVFRHKPRKGVETALYRMGHGEKSIFWYWEIDYESQHYREFRAIDLAEGEKIYQEEDFDSWSEEGPDFEP